MYGLRRAVRRAHLVRVPLFAERPVRLLYGHVVGVDAEPQAGVWVPRALELGALGIAMCSWGVDQLVRMPLFALHVAHFAASVEVHRLDVAREPVLVRPSTVEAESNAARYLVTPLLSPQEAQLLGLERVAFLGLDKTPHQFPRAGPVVRLERIGTRPVEEVAPLRPVIEIDRLTTFRSLARLLAIFYALHVDPHLALELPNTRRPLARLFRVDDRPRSSGGNRRRLSEAALSVFEGARPLAPMPSSLPAEGKRQ
mmetsp:Transcript_36253/g.99915  ORF Transcript_36253/g.99915 Transcript_36253/m.99915 type:complete len:255 (+) Transcript_36253:1267-2031(+)